MHFLEEETCYSACISLMGVIGKRQFKRSVSRYFSIVLIFQWRPKNNNKCHSFVTKNHISALKVFFVVCSKGEYGNGSNVGHGVLKKSRKIQ